MADEKIIHEIFDLNEIESNRCTFTFWLRANDCHNVIDDMGIISWS